MPMVNFSEDELEVLVAHTVGTAPFDDETHPDHEVAISARKKLERAKWRIEQ